VPCGGCPTSQACIRALACRRRVFVTSKIMTRTWVDTWAPTGFVRSRRIAKTWRDLDGVDLRRAELAAARFTRAKVPYLLLDGTKSPATGLILDRRHAVEPPIDRDERGSGSIAASLDRNRCQRRGQCRQLQELERRNSGKLATQGVTSLGDSGLDRPRTCSSAIAPTGLTASSITASHPPVHAGWAGGWRCDTSIPRVLCALLVAQLSNSRG